MQIHPTHSQSQKIIERLLSTLCVALCAILVACGSVGSGKSGSSGGSGSGSGGGSGSGSGGSSGVAISPQGADVRASSTQQFTATVTGAPNNNVTWSVNGVVSGATVTGTITTAGLYSAPTSVPAPNSVTIQAASTSDSTLSSTVTVDILNPIPAIAAIAPSSINAGAFSLAITGTNFVSGAQVMLASSALATSFVSATQLTATGTATSAGNFTVTVVNPDPGSATSNSVNLQVNSSSPPSACSGISLGQGASLNGFIPFPAGNAWNTNISAAQVDPNSAAIINFIGPSIVIHPDFGSGEYQGSSIGIPYVVVGSGQSFVPIDFTAYGDESDPGPMPVPSDAPIEGYPNPGSGDRHVLVLDNSNCWLYELYSSYPNSDGSWNAASAAVWDLLNYEQRPYTWTSADAAGLSIFPGLVRYDEVAGGAIQHAIRFTLANSQAAFVLPATHWAANSTNANAAPMGMRMRLKASFDISSFSAANQVILTALKNYGMIMADNGSSMYISGAPDDRWNNDDLHLLDAVTASDFEVVQMGTIYTASNVPQGAAPTINSFTASSTTVSAGTPVTLTWSTSSASYLIVSPEIGAVRGTSTTVTPSATTTYTLYATNAFGRTTATVTITVQ